MTEFRPDCIINLHVEARGRPEKLAWACTIVHAKRGVLVAARKFLGLFPRETAETEALLFGLGQAARLLQEKVEVAATFPLDRMLTDNISGRRIPPGLKLKSEEIAKVWSGFRFKRITDLRGTEAEGLREDAEKAYERKRRRE
ncbi:MAG TPA: hypothetical protein VIH99_13535 [Bdellovibrionota bacterium]|jgi:hypothetical protein